MAWYEDLEPFAEFGPDVADCVRAVGWLESGHCFRTGRVDAAVYRRLEDLLREPWQPAVALGIHVCDLCLYNGSVGTRNVFIPAGHYAYAAPDLITHYMNAHRYRPPDEFCAAVMNCPPMSSMEYLKAILASARPLARLAF